MAIVAGHSSFFLFFCSSFVVFQSGSLSLEEAGGGEAAETLISYEINVKTEKEKKKAHPVGDLQGG